VSFAFSKSGSKLGYVPSQVDAFLASARQQYLDPQSQTMDAASVRSARFELVKDGYSISAVDTAMEKLEDIFAERELERIYNSVGHQDFVRLLDEGLDLLRARTSRAKGKHFSKRKWPNRGYNRKQVDQFSSRIATHLNQGEELTVKEVRLAVFKTQRGGYAEYQVDAFIEKLVEVLQRENILSKHSR
jgi:DivIVA domain-containing protein